MKKLNQLCMSLFAVLTLVLSASKTFAANDNSVLMVVSGYGLEAGKAQPGYEFDEFAKAYLVFKQHGLSIDVASPKGGPVEADKYDPSKPYNAQVLGDHAIMAKLNNTLSTAKLNPKQYAGIFIVGGKGAMFDLPKDPALRTLVAKVYEQNGSVAAVCHGPAALVDVKLSNGSYLVANKAVNGFTNREEKLFGKKWINQFDFMLEDKLIERGGKFQSSDIMLNHVAVDERLITGQNPSSTVAVATELVRSLGVNVQPLTPYKDDETLAFVAQILDGDTQAAKQLTSNPARYNIQLVGMYGYYYVKTATSEQQHQHALTLMQLAQKTINNPTLDMQIAKTQHTLGNTQGARETLQQVLIAKPDFEPAVNLLKSIGL